MDLDWTYYEAIVAYRDIQAFEINGAWPKGGAPAWAQKIGHSLQIATGNGLIHHTALREITRAFALQLGLRNAN